MIRCDKKTCDVKVINEDTEVGKAETRATDFKILKGLMDKIEIANGRKDDENIDKRWK